MEDYRCIACELKKKAHEAAWENTHDPFGKPLKGGVSGTIGSASPIGVIPTPPKPMPIQQHSSPPPNPVVGEVYHNTNTKAYFVFTGISTGWVELIPASGSGNVPASMAPKVKTQTQTQKQPLSMPDNNDPLTKIMNNIAGRKPFI